MIAVAETTDETIALTNDNPPALRVTKRKDQTFVDYGVSDFIRLENDRLSRYSWEVVVAWRVKNVTDPVVRELADAFLLQRPEWQELLTIIK